MASVNEPRLYVEEVLKKSGSLTLGKQQSHYLSRVLRLGPGDPVFPFNERDGEWRARIASAGKTVELSLREKIHTPEPSGRITLCFAPLKRQQTDMVVQKATELGVAAFRPFFSAYSNTGRIRMDRMQAVIREACEQCGRIRPPEFHAPSDLADVLSALDGKAAPVMLDETAPAGAGLEKLDTVPGEKPIALAVGPEGGFSEAERENLLSLKDCLRLSLGPNRLRAETAAIAGLAVLQARAGDWLQ